MLVLGIDPGTATTGYGVVKLRRKASPQLLSFGWIKTKNDNGHAARLDEIYKSMLKVLREHKPDVVAIERLFFYSNAKTAMRVGQAHGVLLLAAARRRVPVYEYAPGQVKLSVGGNGKADKEQMKKAVRKMFNIRAPRRKKTHFDDAVDAIAVAVCHAKVRGGEQKWRILR